MFFLVLLDSTTESRSPHIRAFCQPHAALPQQALRVLLRRPEQAERLGLRLPTQ